MPQLHKVSREQCQIYLLLYAWWWWWRVYKWRAAIVTRLNGFEKDARWMCALMSLNWREVPPPPPLRKIRSSTRHSSRHVGERWDFFSEERKYYFVCRPAAVGLKGVLHGAGAFRIVNVDCIRSRCTHYTSLPEVHIVVSSWVLCVTAHSHCQSWCVNTNPIP